MFLPPLTPTFDAALRDRSSGDPKYRYAAAAVLASPPDGREAEAIDALVELADDPLGPIRTVAVAGLGAIDASRERPEVLALLRARFDDGHDEVRQAAVRAAARMDRSPDWLVALTKDARAEMRWQAIGALAEQVAFGEDGAEHTDPSATPEIAAALRARIDDEDTRVACAAVESLAWIDRTSANAIAPALEREDTAFSAALALAALGDGRGEPVLIRSLADRTIALEAAEALGEVATERGLEALAFTAARLFTPLLIRAAVGKALARRGDWRGEPALDRVLRAWRPDGRDYAIEAVGKLGLTGLVPALARLCERLRGADPVLLADALRALSTTSDEAKRALDELRSRHQLPEPS